MSSLSEYDYALIKATWLNLTDDNFKCKQAEEKLGKRKDADVVIEYRRIEKGCGKLHDSPKVEIDGFAYHSCLCHDNFQHPNITDFLNMYEDYNKGHLPDVGGSLDQSAKNMEIISLVQGLYQEQELETQRQHQKEMQKTKRK